MFKLPSRLASLSLLQVCSLGSSLSMIPWATFLMDHQWINSVLWKSIGILSFTALPQDSFTKMPRELTQTFKTEPSLPPTLTAIPKQMKVTFTLWSQTKLAFSKERKEFLPFFPPSNHITLNYLQFPKWNLAPDSLWYGVVCNEIILCLGENIQMTKIINFA